MGETVKKRSFFGRVLKFLDDPAGFRLITMIVLYCDIRYLSAAAFYSAMAVLTIWSGFLMIRQLFMKKRIMRVKFRRIIFVFMLVAIFTVILHSEINLLQNLFTLYWITVCFFLFYGIHSEKSNTKVRREIKRLFDVLTVITDLTMLVGLVLFAIFPKGIKLMGYEFCIMEGRFVGIIPNANVTAFYSVICIVMCTILLRIRRADGTATRWLRIFYISSIVINSFVVVLTDSNASVVFIMVYLSFMFFYELFKEFSLKKLHTLVFRLAAAALSCVIVVTSVLFVRVNVQSGISFLLNKRESDIVISTGLDANNDNIKLDKAVVPSRPPEEQKPVIGHQNTNIDSGRFVLWRQALGLIELYPLFGIGKENISDYGVQYLGGIRYTDLAGNKYVDFHNGLLTITVSFGIVGLSLFLVLSLTIAKAILKSMFRHKVRSRRDGNVLVLIAAFAAAYCVYSMFEAALFTDYTYRVFIFWLIIGVGLSYVMKYHQQGIHSAIDPKPLHDDTSELQYIKTKFGSITQKLFPKKKAQENTDG